MCDQHSLSSAALLLTSALADNETWVAIGMKMLCVKDINKAIQIVMYTHNFVPKTFTLGM